MGDAAIGTRKLLLRAIAIEWMVLPFVVTPVTLAQSQYGWVGDAAIGNHKHLLSAITIEWVMLPFVIAWPFAQSHCIWTRGAAKPAVTSPASGQLQPQAGNVGDTEVLYGSHPAIWSIIQSENS